MVGGLWRGLDHEDAARFAFLLATPVILAAGVLKLPSLVRPAGDDIHGQVLVGSLICGITAYFSVRFLVRYFETRTLTPFAIYCLIFGLVSIVPFAFESTMTVTAERASVLRVVGAVALDGGCRVNPSDDVAVETRSPRGRSNGLPGASEANQSPGNGPPRRAPDLSDSVPGRPRPPLRSENPSGPGSTPARLGARRARATAWRGGLWNC